MIVRILGEGQFEVDEQLRGRLEALDAEVEARFQANDEEGFEKALQTLQDEIRSAGRPLDPTTIMPSDLAVPAHGSTLEEVRTLFDSENPVTS